MQHNIILPDLGQTTSEAKIVQWLKKPGDYVSRGEPIVAVATDKVDVEVEAFASGYLRTWLVREGSVTSALAPVAILTDTLEEHYVSAANETEKPAAKLAPAGNAVPGARALARELGIDLARVEGTGPDGLITRSDVQRAAEKPAAPVAAQERALAGMAATVTSSKRDIPHFYVTRDLEITGAARWRDHWNQSQNDAHVSWNDVFVRCAARALGDMPRLNMAFLDGKCEQRSAADVLVVVARGSALLLRPVADPRGLTWQELTRRLDDDGEPVHSPGAAPLLAISNLGMHGVKEFAAIIPPGCTSVLALGAVRETPVARNGAVLVEPVATATLSADHRVIDGIAAAQFLERMQFHLNSL